MEDNKIVIRKDFFIREIEGKVTEYYEVLKKIGEGAFSKVYKVKEKETGELRAMKEVNKSKIGVKKFKTEIKILAMLDLPNILRLFEVIEDEKSIYLILELCTGGELLSRMKNNHYKEKEAAKLMESGVIVNMASTNGTNTYTPLSMDYDASKAGVINLTKNLALRFPNLKICALAPNWIDTDSVLEMDPNYLKEEMRRIGQNNLLKKADVVNKIIKIISSKDIKSGDIILMEDSNE